jgi:lipid II:glycine glycyltransferase (peptidoglycan interpeptide bridge formation enzyme)
VAESRGGSFLQSWEWGEWQVHLGRTVYRFKILDDSGEWAGSVQLIKMPLPLGKYYLYAPYGPVVDLRFKIEDFRFLLQELRKKLPDTIFIRIEPKESFNFQLLTFNLPIVKSTNIQPGKTLLIDLSKTEEQLLGDMHHKTRYNIKVAQKHGVEIKDEFAISIGHGLFFDEALKLIIETSKRQQFATFPPSYYKKMIDFFALGKPREVRLHIYKAIFDSRLLAAAIMIDFGKTRTFLFGGSADEHRNVMAPYLLHWQAIQDAKASGIEVYDFWGTETSSGEVPGFVRFKLGFAPQLRSGSLSGSEQSYAGAYDFIISKLWYRAYGLLRLVNKMLKKISPK